MRDKPLTELGSLSSYPNCESAIEAWERRKRRVNLNNVVVIGNSWNLHDNYELIMRVVNCKYKSIVLCEKEIPHKGCLALPGDFWKKDNRGIIRPNVTDYIPNSDKRYFESFFDVVDWINN